MGPLKGFKIIEIAGIGPGQFAGMLLADMGASVVRIERPVPEEPIFAAHARFNLMNRSRPMVGVDLKSARGVQLVLDLCADADAIFEGSRPGVMERLGLGPEACMARNPKLVYGRMSGWGQQGPLAKTIGHDANFIALSGVYAAIGEKGGDPVYPLNLVGDMGGGGAPFYTAYRTRDDLYIAVAPIENRFYRNLLEVLGLDDIDPASQHDPSQWGDVRQRLQAVFETRTRDEWCEILAGTETCCTPVLNMSEAISHPHNVARKTFINIDGITQPAPAPRFSRTASGVGCAAGPVRADLYRVLKDWGASAEVLAKIPGENQK